MSILQTAAKAAGRPTGRSGPRILVVQKAWHLTPNMIRVTFSGSELDGFPKDRAGANCKLMFPEEGESRDDFAIRIANGKPPVRRTYTVRDYRADVQELDIDFVDHGDTGPASKWASAARAGDFLAFGGPGPAKVTDYSADWYLIGADLSALPVAAVTLEAMPRDAKGLALFEVPSLEDQQEIDAPVGIEVHWLLHPTASVPSRAQEDFIRSLPWPEGRVQTCIAGESGVIRSLRGFLHQEKKVPREDTYISGYWKIGLIEDEHQRLKRAENA